jgi:two-component system NtrC family sensor kinase
MARRRGLQSDVLVSLSVVMVMATTVVAAMLVKTHEAHVSQIRLLAARALIEEARTPRGDGRESAPGIHWWVVEPTGRWAPRGPHSLALPEGAVELASEARRRGSPLLRAGPPWEAVLFAAEVGNAGEVAVAWLPPAVPRGWIAALMLAVVAVFTAFGAYLLRRQLVLPLQRLASAARSIADGESGARVPVDGVAEAADVAIAFNDMTEALEGRTGELEKAVSELRQSNESLRTARAGLARAERLAAVGRLAAGVAHEVGNPMGALLAFVDLALRDDGLSETSRRHLTRAAGEGERVRVILREVLDFSRPPRSVCEAVELPALCEKTADLVRAQRRYAGISIEVTSEGSPPAAVADPSGVAQIVLNVLLNAADALRSETPDPKIQIVVRPAALRVRAGEGAAAAGSRRRFDAVECVVRDNGPGIAEEDRERIFDPFFTTKAPGEGTGLGLSNAARFAEEFGGSLELAASPPGGGAEFVLRLPAAGPPAHSDGARRTGKPS